MRLQVGLFPSEDGMRNETDECLLLIPPDTSVTNSVLSLQEETPSICKRKGIFSNPHITVTKLSMKKGTEIYLLFLLQQIFSKRQKFTVEREDFASFEHRNSTCTIYSKVKEHQPFLRLTKDLKTLRRELKKIGCRIEPLVNNSHLSLVRCLSFSNYKTAMPIYTDSVFQDSFVAEEIVLSKRWTAEYGSHQIKFPLSPLN